VLSWKDCLAYNPAWDTLIWFSVLVSMSSQLTEQGVIGAFAGGAGGALAALHLPWQSLFAVLHLSFFIMHYLFASQTAHVGALLPVFCTLMLAGGVPPKLAALSLAYNVNLFGSLTHYASGQAAVYYGSGFVDTLEVFRIGAVMGALNLAVWGVAGMAWWKVLGWW
jgi:DASS family divalent anion:Na+ symporter